ncbi:MAG: FMN-binding negative transcriptional regulator [Alphaproteobacteria bacterium]
MYLPPHFTEADIAAMHALMRAHDFALIIAARNGVPEAAHLPVLLDSERGVQGTLVAHMARANTLWRAFDGTAETLVVFQGPHAYVSPRWYEDGGVGAVPTWNYAAVHAYGTPRLIEDETRVRQILARLAAKYESGSPSPWTIESAPRVVEKLLPGIVTFEIPIARIAGKWKLSQNRSAGDRAGVASALSASADAGARGVAALMAAREGRKAPA